MLSAVEAQGQQQQQQQRQLRRQQQCSSSSAAAGEMDHPKCVGRCTSYICANEQQQNLQNKLPWIDGCSENRRSCWKSAGALSG
jgi:hypothetical protein